jgi:hypothetical protein
MSGDLSTLIDLVVSDAELVTGRKAGWMMAQGASVRPVLGKPSGKPARWTTKEDDFLRENRPYMSVQEIAQALGRPDNAVKVRATRLGAKTPRHAPGYISGNQIAHLLGIDSHKPPTWIDLGVLQGELFPYPGRVNRRVKTCVFRRWLIKPTSWVYFDVKRIKNNSVRRLVELAQEKWGDEWLNTRQAADLLKCTSSDICRQIKLGRLYGYHAIGMDRRREFRWAYWFVRRSDVEKLNIPKGRGAPKKSRIWTDRADAFILHAKDALNLRHIDIARMMKRTEKQIQYRYKVLRKAASHE